MTATSRDATKRKRAPIEKALLILPEYLEKILQGKKTWELRSQPTRIRGKIALAAAGEAAILGTCTLVDCVGPLSFSALLAGARKVGRSRSDILASRQDWEWRCRWGLHAWVISSPHRLARPIPFRNPPGAVIWVRLPLRVSKRL